MKNFTITLPNKTTDNKGIYKNYLLNRLANAYPELTIDGIDGPESEYSYQYIGPNDRVAFGYSPNYNVSKFGCPCKACLRNCPFSTSDDYKLSSDLIRAMKKLDDYAKAQRLPRDYDYVFNGMPVREYQSFIQIGNTIIPKNNGSYNLNSLNYKQKITVINVINVINNSNTLVINQ